MEKWQTMESAPKDRRILLAYDELGRRVVCGQWNDDAYSKNPRPYWSNDLEYVYGKNITRSAQPVAWMELPVFDGFGHGDVMDLEAGAVVRHKESGVLYTVIVPIAYMEASVTSAVVYQSEDNGVIWVRPRSEFADRFEEVK